MDEKHSDKSERFSPMSASVEAAALLHELAEPRSVDDTVKVALLRTARLVGFTASRTKAIWYGEARRIDADEMDAIRAAAQHKRRAIGKLVSIRSAAESSSLDRESVARFIDMLRRMGAQDSSGDV